MALLFIAAFAYLSLRTLLLFAQANRHTPEARLGRAFQQELQSRGLTVAPADSDRLIP